MSFLDFHRTNQYVYCVVEFSCSHNNRVRCFVLCYTKTRISSYILYLNKSENLLEDCQVKKNIINVLDYDLLFRTQSAETSAYA